MYVMYVCMYVCVFVCMYVFNNDLFSCVCARACTCMRACVGVCACARACVFCVFFVCFFPLTFDCPPVVS